MCAANCGMWGGGLCVRCKLFFLQYNKNVFNKYEPAVPYLTTRWQCDTAETNKGAVPSVQSLSAAGQHNLPSEEEVRGGNPIDLMVCLHFNQYRSSWVMLHDNCVTVWCTQALWIWYLHSLCVHAIIIALFSSRVSCFPSLVFLFILTKLYLLLCKGTSQKIHKI